MKAVQATGSTARADGPGDSRERDGTGRDGTGRDGTGRDGTGRDGTGRPDGAGGARDELLASLHDHARRLAAGLPGQLGRIRLCSGDVAIEIEWLAQPGAVYTDRPVPESTRPDSAETGAAGTEAAFVTSPVVGTFYRAPEPNAEPFVKVGDVVQPGQVVGVVEAMKLMNPVTVEIGGTVARICVKNGEPVEFDQDLVEVKPHL